MADNTILHGAPGIAAYASETWGNVREIRLQDNPAAAMKKVTITAGADLNLPVFSVVSLVGLATMAGDPSVSNAIGITTAPIVVANGQTVTLDVIVAGYFDFNALNWGGTFNTDALKKAAFDGRPAPINIILDTNKFNSDGVLA